MSLVSAVFLGFVAVVALIYYLLPNKAKPYVLLAGSVAFLAVAGAWTLGFVLFTAITTFFAGKIAAGKGEGRSKTVAAVIAIVINIALMCAVKYYGVLDLITTDINNVTKAADGSFLAVAVPLGMSFYTLQMTGYVLDCLWGIIPAEKNFFKYLLFACYFPYMTSGPLNHYGELSKEFTKPITLEYENIRKGIVRIAWGFFLKLVIAERASVIVNAVYGDHQTYTGPFVLLGVTLFALQLYTDFMACMEVAIGTSYIFGIKLPENFNSPYMALSIREYWQRWHITLGTWLRDFLYYPLLKSAPFIAIGDKAKKAFGKKNGKKVPVYLAMLVLWTAVGYWHGGLWKYVIGSGLLHCFYIVGGMIAEPLFAKMRKPFKPDKLPYKIFCGVRTFVLVLIGFFFFRAANVPDALQLFRALFTAGAMPEGGILATGISLPDIIVLAVSTVMLIAVDIYKFRPDQNAEPRLVTDLTGKLPVAVRILLLALLIIAIAVFGKYGLGYDSASFIYARI
ncbi:MAG: MBOAT family protein [Clostridiales bacterium]|nr:MBOAT family protein [Clostridiales bacterium]